MTKTIVMTGATAGLGRPAADDLMRASDTRLIVGSRGASVAGAETLPLDLSDLTNVRHFADTVLKTLGDEPIDVLVLNAGLNAPTDALRTVDGYERTFATNHLAHYLLLRLLSPRLADGAVVVITSSDTHDPTINRLAPPLHADALKLARPDLNGPGAAFIRGFRAYSTSKLCNILTARAFAELPETTARNIRVVTYNPGFTPGTQLTRSAPAAVRAIVPVVANLLRPFLSISSVEQAGRELANLALGETTPPPQRIYASLVGRDLTWPDPAPMARRDDLMHALWRDSAGLVGLNP